MRRRGGRPSGARWVAALVAALCIAGGQRAGAQGLGGECEPGEREVRALAFRGNTVFRDADLVPRVATTASDLVRRTLRAFGTRRCLDSDELRLDVGRLRLLYRRHGYYQTRVDTTVTALHDGYGGVRVTFEIDEGLPTLVDSVSITGLDAATAPIAAVENLGVRRGMILDVTRLQAAADSLRTRLRNNGYPRADVAAGAAVFDTLGRRARVSLGIAPGPRARIAAIQVIDEPLPGRTRRLGDDAVRRLVPLREGDLYRERALIEAQRTLYQSDLFQHVEVSTLPGETRSGDTLVTVRLAVRENYLRQLDSEVGWAVLDCFKVRAQLVDKNFLGEAQRVELAAQLSKLGYGEPTRVAGGRLCATALDNDPFSARLNYSASATVRLPTLFGRRSSPALSVYSERRGEYQAYLRTTLVGGQASVASEVAPALPLRLAYSLEYGRTSAQPALLCALFNRCDSESRASLTEKDRPFAVLSARLDRVRTDDPVQPRSGTVARLEARGAAREIGSSRALEFVKGLADASFYRPLRGGVVLAARLRVGTVLGRSLSFSDSSGFIPPEERLYAGGAASVRGFQQNELGDLIYIAEDRYAVFPLGGASALAGDTAFLAVAGDARIRRVVPVGGDALVVGNLELRVRSPVYPELVQYTLFTDAGDVWQRGRPIAGREHRASSLWLNGLRWTPGVGIRVFTPVGPFQANVGYNPYPRPPGAIYFDAAPDPTTGIAPLYCVSPGNRVLAVKDANGVYQQPAGSRCPATFAPGQSATFLSRLTFTFSIGPDF